MEEAITNEVKQRETELVALLSKLIAFPTVSPPARNTNDVQEFIQHYLMNLGFKTDKWDVYPNDPNVVGTLQGESPREYNSLIINGHIDVAEVGVGEEWSSSPFTLKVQNPYLYGRGVADMKGGIAASLIAIKLLKELGITLQGDLQFQSVIGEEVGEAGTLACIERGYTADYAVVVDTSDLHIQGQGGVITGWITIESKETFHDGLRRTGTRQLISSYEKMLNQSPFVGMSETVTDAGWLGRAGIPTVIFGPGKLEDAHAVNEKVEIQQLLDFTKILAVFMAKWCNTKKEEVKI
ncbi:MAG: M20/M25/M40 family metallo-hydrolase [Neobacillus sp.]